MASFNCMLWILRYTFLYLITQVFTKDDLVVKDHLLVGHVFQTVNTDDWLNCIQVCFDEPRCISYNFKTRKSTCQLNDCGLDEMCDRDKSLIYSRGFMFQQIRPTRKVNNLSELIYHRNNQIYCLQSSNAILPELNKDIVQRDRSLMKISFSFIL